MGLRLEADGTGGFVFAEAFEGSLSDEVVGGPGGEGDLRHEFGVDPADAAGGSAGQIGERRGAARVARVSGMLIETHHFGCPRSRV